MKIQFPSFTPIQKITPARPSFSGINNTVNDSFEKNVFHTFDYYGAKITGEKVKDVKFENRNGGFVDGFIMRNTYNPHFYYACTPDEIQCKMELSDLGECLFINTLVGKNNNGKIKGAGTELIKYAAEMSIDKGYKGKLQLLIGGSGPFYYKNNFRINRYTDSLEKNLALDYATKTGDTRIINGNRWGTPLIELDEQGAKDLLSGKRYFDNSRSKVLYQKSFDIYGIKTDFDIYYCDLGNKFAIQMIDKSGNFFEQAAVASGRFENDTAPVIEQIEIKYPDDDGKLENELKEAIKTLQKTVK